MPNQVSSDAYFLAIAAFAARVFVGCGVMAMSRTSDMTSLFSPPRIGSGQTNTGFSTQSDCAPGACSVLDPSKPQIGGASPIGTTLALERSLAVGFEPSIQMYSAR